jgi:hypothetical protein
MRRHRNPLTSVSKQPSPDNPGALRLAAPPEPEARSLRPEFEGHMNGLRLAVGRTDALANALVRYFDERDVLDDPDVAERRASHLVDLTAECAVQACEELDLACETVGWEGDDERS